MNHYQVTRLTRFQEKFQNKSIEDYFDIVGENSNETINFTCNVMNEIINLEIKFVKRNTLIYDIHELPLDISRKIFEYYNTDFIFININIIYHNRNTPFIAPIWYLNNVKHNLTIPIDLTEYYNDIIAYHNSLNRIQWSPAIDVDKDMLDFIQKINHFDYMLNNKNFIDY